jgi:hypothetical protein
MRLESTVDGIEINKVINILKGNEWKSLNWTLPTY